MTLLTLRDLKEALAEVSDHWLDTRCSFSLDKSPLSEGEPFTMKIVGDIAEFGVSSGRHGPEVWHGFQLDELVEGHIDTFKEDEAAQEQALLTLADAVACSYSDRILLLRNNYTIEHGLRKLLQDAFKASSFTGMLERLADGGKPEQAIGRALLWAQRNAENVASRHV